MRWLLVLAGLAVVIGCGEDDGGAAAGGSSLEGIPWVDESGPSAYTLDGSDLDIGQVATTNMACVGPADATEREFLAALDRVAG